MSPHARLLAASMGLVLAALIGAATYLEPDARGWGTHEQLGLAPCTFRNWVGGPCPTCGMTTAWAYAVRGNVQAAVVANLSGTLLLGAVLPAAAWMIGSAASGRWLLGRPPARWVMALATLWLVVAIVDWVRRLAGL